MERKEFAPCAVAMMRLLDRAEMAVEVIADRSRPESERIRAKQECLAASAGLGGLLRQAGGSQKLIASWADSRLKEFSLAVLSSKDWYTMVCYYGPRPFEQAGASIPRPDPYHATARAILSEIR